MNILVYGDSNTWGYVPTLEEYSGDDTSAKRYAENEIWWSILKKNHNVTANGLNGRTCGYDHWIQEGKNASKTLDDDLKDIKDIDLTIIMLGTNDFKFLYHPSVENTIINLDSLVKRINKRYNCDFCIVCPPLIISGTPVTIEQYRNGEDWIKKFHMALENYAKENNYNFASAITCEIGVDGEHLTKRGHQSLGYIINKVING